MWTFDANEMILVIRCTLLLFCFLCSSGHATADTPITHIDTNQWSVSFDLTVPDDHIIIEKSILVSVDNSHAQITSILYDKKNSIQYDPISKMQIHGFMGPCVVTVTVKTDGSNADDIAVHLTFQTNRVSTPQYRFATIQTTSQQTHTPPSNNNASAALVLPTVCPSPCKIDTAYTTFTSYDWKHIALRCAYIFLIINFVCCALLLIQRCYYKQPLSPDTIRIVATIHSITIGCLLLNIMSWPAGIFIGAAFYTSAGILLLFFTKKQSLVIYCSAGSLIIVNIVISLYAATRFFLC